MTLPSKKLTLLTVACAISLGTILWAVNAKPRQENVVKNTNTGVESQNLVMINTKNTDIDSDGDGLKDWEEVLWKTDPRRADSDSDGIKDGDEAVIIKDKTTARASTTSSDLVLASTGAPGTITAEFSKEIFSKYMELKKGGTKLNASGVDDLAKNFINNSPALDLKPTEYVDTDFLPIVRETNADIKVYGNELGRIVTTNSPRTKENELYIFLLSIQNSDEKKLADLDPIISGYKNIIKQAAAMKVPESALSVHAELLTSMSAVEKTIEGMSKLYSDPIVAIPSMNAYQTSVASMSVAFRSMIAYFNSQGVTFTPGETGYNLVHTL